MDPLDLPQVLALAAVVEEGSFEAAAARLHVTPSAVSQRVKALERRVGSVLVRRTRPCTATEAGLPLVRLAAQWRALERAVRDDVGLDAGGPLRLPVAVNADSLSTWFPDAMADVVATGDVLVEVRREDQDHSARLLREGGVAAAVTADGAPVQGCRVQPLGAMRYVAATSPDYAERYLADGASGLATAPVLVWDDKDALQHRFLEEVLGARVDPPAHVLPSSRGFVEILLRGHAWGMLPDVTAEPHLRAGRLVEVDRGRVLDVPLFWQHWRLGTPALERLTAAVRVAASRALHGAPG